MGLFSMGIRYGYGGLDDFFRDPGFAAILSIAIGVMLVFFIIGAAAGMALYILRSIGLYRLALNRRMGGAVLAWIPFVGFYRIGSIADDISSANGAKSYYRYILLIGGIINTVSSFLQNAVTIPRLSRFFNDPSRFGSFRGNRFRYPILTGTHAVLFIASAAVFVITLIALHKIYKCYRPGSSTLWTALSVIFPFMQSIFVFIIRNYAPPQGWDIQNGYPFQNHNWQDLPPQYPPYGPQAPAGGGYTPPQYAPPPADMSYAPPAAPNPPAPHEAEGSASQPPLQPPWEKNNPDL